MSQRTPPARPSSPAPTADLAGKHLCINHFRTGSCSAGSSCRGIHLPDAARHSALREAAVKPAASDQVFSLDDVRKVVRQELFCAHRGRGRRGNGSERRRAGKQEYWVAEKRRRRVQASHERIRRRNSVLFRLVQTVVDVSLFLSRWRSRAHLPSLFFWWKETAAASARSVLLFAISRRVQTRQVRAVLQDFKWVLVGWRLNMVFRSGAIPSRLGHNPFSFESWSSLMRCRLEHQEQGGRWKASGMRFWEFMCSDLVYDPRYRMKVQARKASLRQARMGMFAGAPQEW